MLEQQQGKRDVTIVNNARCVMERPQVVASLVLSGNAYRKPKVTRYDLSPMLDTVPAANLPQSNGDPSFGPLLRFFASKYFVNAKDTFDGIKVPTEYADYLQYRKSIVEQLGDDADDAYVDDAIDNWCDIIVRRNAAATA